MRGEGGVPLAQPVGVEPWPAVFLRIFHHARTNRGQFNVARAGQHVVFRPGLAGATAASPQRTAAPATAVDVLHVAPPQVFHHQRGAVFMLLREQQMHVIGHRCAGTNRANEVPAWLPGSTLPIRSPRASKSTAPEPRGPVAMLSPCSKLAVGSDRTFRRRQGKRDLRRPCGGFQRLPGAFRPGR